jgi:class 3 adenylate cyclase
VAWSARPALPTTCGAAVNLAYQVSGVAAAGYLCHVTVYDVMRDTRTFVSAGEVTVDGAEQPIWRLSERQP